MDEKTTVIKEDSLSEGMIYVKDNRIRFEDGRFYITQTPYKNSEQSDFPEKIDVTEEVAKAIAKYLRRNRLWERLI